MHGEAQMNGSPGMTGMTDASATRRPLIPNTLSAGSTTALPPAADAIAHVPTFAFPECTCNDNRDSFLQVYISYDWKKLAVYQPTPCLAAML